MLQENISCIEYLPLTKKETQNMLITHRIEEYGFGMGKIRQDITVFNKELDIWERQQINYEKFGKLMESLLSKLVLI